MTLMLTTMIVAARPLSLLVVVAVAMKEACFEAPLSTRTQLVSCQCAIHSTPHAVKDAKEPNGNDFRSLRGLSEVTHFTFWFFSPFERSTIEAELNQSWSQVFVLRCIIAVGRKVRTKSRLPNPHGGVTEKAQG